MENIGELLSSVLNDPDAMAKLKSTAEQLGIDPNALTSDNSDNTKEDSAPSQPKSVNTDMLSAMTRITPLLSRLNEEDDMSRLIHALKPYLSGNRRKKADEADKIMVLMRLIPLLKQGRL